MATVVMRSNGDSAGKDPPVPENPTGFVCAVCGTPIALGKGRFSVGDRHYHPKCYEVKGARGDKADSS